MYAWLVDTLREFGYVRFVTVCLREIGIFGLFSRYIERIRYVRFVTV